MAKPHRYQGSHNLEPSPVAWSAEREARGAAKPSGPRCPGPACAVRYVSGTDRPCPEHAPPRPVPTASQRAMVATLWRIARTPARLRVVRALLADAARSNRVVARETATGHALVQAVRHELETARAIDPYRAPSGSRSQPAPQRERAMAALLRDAARSNRAVAAEAGTNNVRVMAARHALEAAGRIPVYRAPSGPVT